MSLDLVILAAVRGTNLRQIPVLDVSEQASITASSIPVTHFEAGSKKMSANKEWEART
jgi:hypothetical protein